MKIKEKPHWFVLLDDFGNGRVISYDIFKHAGFSRDFDKNNKTIVDDVEFLDAIKRDLHYYFWAKCEYEILVSGLFVKNDSERMKIDVYDQIEMNWDAFAKYILSFRI